VNQESQFGDFGRYQIVRLLGIGGMGMVFLAEEKATGQRVAIKALRPELAKVPAAAHRFWREAGHMRRLAHPHVLAILAVSEGGQGPYLVMPFMERGSLAHVLAGMREGPGERGRAGQQAGWSEGLRAGGPSPTRTLKARDAALPLGTGGPLEPEFILKVGRQLASALSAAHKKGVIHQDLKPANILLDAEGNAFLTDFGMARSLANDSMLPLQEGQVVGTGPYLSPAMAAGEAEDTRGDIYAFGALLYEMLTGCPPYESTSPADVTRQILAGPPRPILKLDPNAPRGLVRIAEGAMARSLSERYPSMTEVEADLQRVAEGREPIGPPLPLPVVSLWRKATRDAPRLATLGAAAVLAITVAALLWPTPVRLRLLYKITASGVSAWRFAQPGDWDGNGEPELFIAQGEDLFAVSPTGEVIREKRIAEADKGYLLLGFVQDLDGDRKSEVVASWTVGTNLTVAVFDQDFNSLKRFQTAGAWELFDEGPSHSTIQPRLIADLDGDGKRELLATLATGRARAPRGIACFGLESERPNWTNLSGPTVTEVVLLDLNGDGRQDVVFGSSATSNTNVGIDGTDDRFSYLHALLHDGTRLWTKKLDGYYTEVHPLLAKRRSDSGHALVAWITGADEHRRKRGGAEVGRIASFDFRGEQICQYDPGVRLMSCVCVDLDADGQDEIVATDRLGFVHVLDARLHPQQLVELVPRRFDRVDLRLVAVTTLPAAKPPHLIFTSAQVQFLAAPSEGRPKDPAGHIRYQDVSILIGSADLAPVAEYRLAKQAREEDAGQALVADFTGDGEPEIVSLRREALVLEFLPAVGPREKLARMFAGHRAHRERELSSRQ
jgi:serine/threonine protein kinase